jgi:hypothetical protein
MARGRWVKEHPQSHTFKERDSPPVAVLVSTPTSSAESFERKANIGRDVSVHSEQLAHDASVTYRLELALTDSSTSASEIEPNLGYAASYRLSSSAVASESNCHTVAVSDGPNGNETDYHNRKHSAKEPAKVSQVSSYNSVGFSDNFRRQYRLASNRAKSRSTNLNYIFTFLEVSQIGKF